MVDNTESKDKYRSVVKLGRRYIAEHEDDEYGGMLPVLETFLPGYMELGSVKLGVVDAPMSKIRGTVASGRASAFAGNFLPLLPENSEFAQKWAALYNAHLKEGIREPGTALEYLGYYYIIEGNKRVSVLKALDSPSVQLDVTRIIPSQPEAEKNPEAGRYLELLNADPRRPVITMWFSEAGRYTRLIEMMNRAAQPDWPEDWMEDAFSDFRIRYHELGYQKLPITTGDAFFTFVEIYGFPYKWEAEKTSGALKELERQLQYQAGEPKLPSRIVKQKIKRAIFVYDHSPQDSYWDAVHDYGRRVLENVFPEAEVEFVTGLAEAEDPDQLLQSVCDQDTVVFVNGIGRRNMALRALLSQKDSHVFQCYPKPDALILPSYYGRTSEPAFVLGALAGSLTVTGMLGVIACSGGGTADGELDTALSDIGAFALGARMVNKNAHVVSYESVANSGHTGWDTERAALAAKGCDIMLIPYLSENTEGYGFPGVIAQLAAINLPTCYVSSYLAASAWHFGAFYSAVCASLWQEGDGILNGRHPGLQAMHLESGLDSGLLEVHVNHAELPDTALLLVNAMKRMVRQHGIPEYSGDDIEIERIKE